MRDRDTIEDEQIEVNSLTTDLILEVLLDIRELLQAQVANPAPAGEERSEG